MPTLSEIMRTPETLEKAAENFANFDGMHCKPRDGMNQDIQTDEEFIKLMDACGTSNSIDYKKFCKIDLDD